MEIMEKGQEEEGMEEEDAYMEHNYVECLVDELKDMRVEERVIAIVLE